MLLLAACKPGTPSQYIQPGEMEDILVDYYMARAMAQEDGNANKNREYNTALYIEAVLKKHGLTQAELDSSLVYYYTRADRFADIFERVSERIEEQALALGASEGEIGKYAQLNANGDTANVWADRSTAILTPTPPYNRWEFNIDADSTYRFGDQMMMMFQSDYMYQTGEKGGMLYIAVDYGDTVVARNLHFSTSGVSQLRVPEDSLRRIKTVKGFFYLNGGFEVSPSTRLLFLNNVQLIRFHTKDENYTPSSLPRDSIDGGKPIDEVGSDRDSIGRSDTLLPPQGRAALHRMDAGADSAKTR